MRARAAATVFMAKAKSGLCLPAARPSSMSRRIACLNASVASSLARTILAAAVSMPENDRFVICTMPMTLLAITRNLAGSTAPSAMNDSIREHTSTARSAIRSG